MDRRQFIQTATGAALTAAVPSVSAMAAPAPESSKKMIGIQIGAVSFKDEGTDAVIVELGANDALRGTDPAVTRAALSDILTRLKARKIAVLLCGMLAPPNYGKDYSDRFSAIFPELSKSFGVPLYPFFLDGVAADAKLNLADGIHPTPAGVDIIVKNIMPKVEALLGTIKQQGH